MACLAPVENFHISQEFRKFGKTKKNPCVAKKKAVKKKSRYEICLDSL
jgi:hypothetical protein